LFEHNLFRRLLCRTVSKVSDCGSRGRHPTEFEVATVAHADADTACVNVQGQRTWAMQKSGDTIELGYGMLNRISSRSPPLRLVPHTEIGGALDRRSMAAAVRRRHKMAAFSWYLRYLDGAAHANLHRGCIASKWVSFKEKQWLVRGITKRKPKHNSIRP
jgi:hypothetical protein